MTSFLKFISFLFTLAATVTESQCRCFRSIISFGDSIADTGNLLRLSDSNHLPHSAFPPYGETFFHHPTGRFSDGRLIIDFIAEYLGLPYVAPFSGNPNGDFDKGINFAVGGATALDPAIFEEIGVHFVPTNFSLGVQLNIFKQILPKLCGSSSDCSKMLGDSLILMGEIGGNDYNHPLYEGKSIEEVRELVPLVMNAISSAITELIDMGGRTMVVPGNFPIGCTPVCLKSFQTSNKEEYDPLTGCLTWLNELAEYHNEQLHIELNRIQKLYPNVNIIYADYYNPTLRFYQDPTKFGFVRKLLPACCGEGGPYRCSKVKFCGTPGVNHCHDPSKHVSWDGIHMTEAAYRWVAEDVLKGLFANPRINSSCLTFKFEDGVLDHDYSFVDKVY